MPSDYGGKQKRAVCEIFFCSPSPARGAGVGTVVRESSAEEGSSMEKPTTLLGRSKPSTVISGNVKSFVVGHGSGTVDLLLSSSLGPYYMSPDVT